MDQTLKLKIDELEKAIKTLKDVFEQEESDLAKDAAIKRFEYCFELCWKSAKVFLSERFGVSVYSPKECFRELAKNKIISDQDVELFLEMTDYRNRVVHTYSQNFADAIYEKIKNSYLAMLEKVLVKIKNENGARRKN